MIFPRLDLNPRQVGKKMHTDQSLHFITTNHLNIT